MNFHYQKAQLIFGIFLSIIDHTKAQTGIACSATNGGACQGASYCVATWISKSGTWIQQSAYCVKTSIPFNGDDTWSLSTATGIVTHKCAANGCNAASPQGVIIPTVTPTSAPSQIQCNSIGGGQCNGSACYIVATSSFTFENCAPAAIGSTVANAPGQQYCSQAIGSYVNNQPLKSTVCYCRSSALCNNQSLLSWGNSQINNLDKVSCHVGTDINPGSFGSAFGQYCYYSQTTNGGKTITSYAAISSTMGMPKMGCISIYGNDQPSTTCACSSNNCNLLQPFAPITPGPTRTTTSKPTVTQKTSLTTTPAQPGTNVTMPHTSPTTTQNPITGGVVEIMLSQFADPSGQLYSGAQCDPFWFTGLDKCDMALQLCVEPASSSPSLSSCATEWLDMQQITQNANAVTFGPASRYGGWTNPMVFQSQQFQYATGFSLKYFAEDVDNGNRQLIDRYGCSYLYQGMSNWGTVTCNHQRPTGYNTMLKFAYLRLSNPTPKKPWKVVPGSSIVFFSQETHFMSDDAAPDLLETELQLEIKS